MLLHTFPRGDVGVATYLDVGSFDLDVDPVVRAEGDGQQGRGDDRRDGRERQGDS